MKYDLKIVDDYIKAIEYYNFQDFCDRLLLTLYPTDFTPVRAGGRNGDMKNDGYCYMSRKFFQAHATRGESAKTTKKKIEEDLVGCLGKWDDVKEFIYITNDTLIGEVERFVDKLRKQYPTVTIRTWTQKVLIEKIRKLEIQDVEYVIDRRIIPEISISYDNLISTKFLITENFNFLKEISNLNLENFPFDNSIILNNEVLKFTKNLTVNQNFRHDIVTKKSKVKQKDYLKKFPNTVVFEKDIDEYQWKIYERIPSSEEIKNRIKDDCVTDYLIRYGITSDKIAKVMTYIEDGCGGSGDFLEDYILRPLWAQYLIIKNLSDEIIELKNIIHLKHTDILYSESDIKIKHDLELPKIPIEPNQNIIIPIGIFLDDFDKSEKKIEYEVTRFNTSEQYQITDFGSIKRSEKVEYIGPSIIPTELIINKNERKEIKSIHGFDFDNVYWVDRHWGYGSCPHLFYNYSGYLKYQGEILNLNPNTIQLEKLIIPEGVSEILIAELEKEITYVNYIQINGRTICQNVSLSEGDYYSFKVKQNDVLLIEGFYKVLFPNFIVLPRADKQRIIEKFNRNYAQ